MLPTGLPANSQAAAQKTPRFFLPSRPPELRRATGGRGCLGWVSGGAVAVVSAATAPRAEAPFPEKQQRHAPGEGED